MKHGGYRDGSICVDDRLSLHSERADLAPREEHHVRRPALELAGVDRACHHVEGSGLQNGELRSVRNRPSHTSGAAG